jgi:hypothetical protein
MPTTLWHDGQNNSAEVPAGGQHLQKKGGSAGKVVVREPCSELMHFLWWALETTSMPWSQAIESVLIPKGSLGAVDCRVNCVLERKGVKEQDGLADLMKFRIW